LICATTGWEEKREEGGVRNKRREEGGREEGRRTFNI
jgi:hypothetical protein